MRAYKNCVVRVARLEDAFKLASHLRTEDLIEIRSAHKDRPPYKSLVDGIVISSPDCWTIEANNGDIIGIFGVARVSETVGSVWLLGSGRIKSIQREFLRHSRFWMDMIQEKYPLLGNVVYAENTIHIRWLKWLGFTFIRKIEKYGHFGLPFYEFVRIRKDHV